jgi:hypothetical protein
MEELINENKILKEEILLLKEKLEKYATQHKKYYETNKELINEKAKHRLKKIAEENPEKIKEYIYPSGKIIKVQGYENYALDFLLNNENINENSIITSRKLVPEIWYIDNNDKKRRHYVDIFIPSQNRCIEVKSTWTAEKKKDCIFLKQSSAKKLGYNYEIWVYHGKGNIVNKYC